jgi:thymidine kinase
MEAMDTREFEEKISNKISDDLEFFQRIKDEKVEINNRTVISDANTYYVRKFLVEIESIENIFYVGISTLYNNFSAIKDELNDFQSVLLRNLV